MHLARLQCGTSSQGRCRKQLATPHFSPAAADNAHHSRLPECILHPHPRVGTASDTASGHRGRAEQLRLEHVSACVNYCGR